jgi:dCTP deaminase
VLETTSRGNADPRQGQKEETMILSDSAILAARDRGEIVIEPFKRECLGSNSYDVHLGKNIAFYEDDRTKVWLDAAINHEHSLEHRDITSDAGYCLEPGRLYLGVTEEYTESHAHVPMLDGKSSIGRLGISIHVTAGKGDVGFCGHWTMEIFVIHPVLVYAGMPIGQLTYFTVEGEVERPYGAKAGSKYQHGRQENPKPQGSSMHRNFR